MTAFQSEVKYMKTGLLRALGINSNLEGMNSDEVMSLIEKKSKSAYKMMKEWYVSQKIYFIVDSQAGYHRSKREGSESDSFQNPEELRSPSGSLRQKSAQAEFKKYATQIELNINKVISSISRYTKDIDLLLKYAVGFSELASFGGRYSI